MWFQIVLRSHLPIVSLYRSETKMYASFVCSFSLFLNRDYYKYFVLKAADAIELREK